MCRFELCMQHTQASIQRMAQAAYDAFEGRQKLVRCLAALACLALGAVASLPLAVRVLLLAWGSYACVSVNNPVRSRVDSVLQVVAQNGGRYPCTLLRFEEDALYAGAKGGGPAERVEYRALLRLMEDEEYFYLFVHRGAALMAPKAALGAAGPATLRQFLQQKTGLEVVPLLPWWRRSLASWRRCRRNTRLPAQGRQAAQD